MKCRCRARAGSFVTLVLNFLIVVRRVSSNLLVVLLQGSKVLTGFENPPSSIPSPTYQWTNARLEYMRSNLWSRRDQASAIEVVWKKHADSTVNLGEIAIGDMLGEAGGGYRS